MLKNLFFTEIDRLTWNSFDKFNHVMYGRSGEAGVTLPHQ